MTSIQDLVEMKKTRRLADFEVISSLVRIRLTAVARPTRSLLKWALRNVYRIEDAQWLLERWPAVTLLSKEAGRPWLSTMLHASELDSPTLQSVLSELATEIGIQQQKDMQYWSPIIQELRELRRNGRLLPEGAAL